MAGIYIHIPFCKQACTYCNFHFSTSSTDFTAMIDAIMQEIILQKDYFQGGKVTSIYFGGGTPSILPPILLEKILKCISENFLTELEEITIEGNPDDLTLAKMKSLFSLGFNRLSVGVQSFLDSDLKWMHRAHSVLEARSCIENIENAGFNNFSVDLIYGLPHQTMLQWQKNIEIILSYKPPHISSYALTVEPKTILFHQLEKNPFILPDESVVENQYFLLCDLLSNAGYDHYEISNFAQFDSYAKHNSSYWKGDLYLGIGPSAHSFNSKTRSWNVANNALYIQSMKNKMIPCESEVITETMKLNEYLMVSLRTKWGADEKHIKQISNKNQYNLFQKEKEKKIQKNILSQEENTILITPNFWFIADKIISDLFFED